MIIPLSDAKQEEGPILHKYLKYQEKNMSVDIVKNKVDQQLKLLLVKEQMEELELDVSVVVSYKMANQECMLNGVV